MTTIINHDIRSVNGKYIRMPAYKGGQSGWGNLAIPSPYTESTKALYPIGTKFVDDDRIFRYVYAGNSCTRGRVLQSWNAYSTGTTREYALIATAGVADDTTIECTTQGTVTANLFAGGYCIVTAGGKLMYRVESNTATSGSTFINTLDNPIRNAIADSDYIQVVRDKYADVRYLSSGEQAGWGSGVCVPHWTITSSSYSWGQTWGPCTLALMDDLGASISERGLVMLNDGAVWKTSADVTKGYQYIGYMIPYTGAGPSGVDAAGAWAMVELQLAP